MAEIRQSVLMLRIIRVTKEIAKAVARAGDDDDPYPLLIEVRNHQTRARAEKKDVPFLFSLQVWRTNKGDMVSILFCKAPATVQQIKRVVQSVNDKYC